MWIKFRSNIEDEPVWFSSDSEDPSSKASKVSSHYSWFSSIISEEENESEEDTDSDNEIRINFHSCPKLPSMIEDCNPLIERWPSIMTNIKNKRITIDDFMLLKALSHGAYGKVCLARRKTTRDLFAIKIINKLKIQTDK